MIEFLNLQKLNKPYQKEFTKKAKKIIKSGWYILGSELEKFEKNFARYNKANYCLGVGNGYDALFLILKAYKELGILCDGDKILLPANSYIATILAVSNNNLQPILVDIDKTYNISPKQVKKSITKKTKAILAISLYGQSADYLKLQHIAKKHNLKLIADDAQAHGATHHDKPHSSYCDAVAFSFYPTKNLGCLGDGGAVVTHDKKLYETIKSIRNYGSSSKNIHPLKGVNSRLDEIQAGFLNIKLKYLKKITKKRQKIAKFYLSNIKNPLIKLPKVKKYNSHIWHLFVLECKQREKLIDYLNTHAIQTAIHYPSSVYKQKAYKNLKPLSHKVTDISTKNILSIPLNETLSKKELSFIVDKLNKFGKEDDTSV